MSSLVIVANITRHDVPVLTHDRLS